MNDNEGNYMMNWKNILLKILLTTLFTLVIGFACVEFFYVCQGTGEDWGGFSLKWGIIFILYFLLSLSLILVVILEVWKPQNLIFLKNYSLRIRGFLKYLDWIIGLIVFFFPIYFLQYTPWGAIFFRPFFRLFLWVGCIFITAYFFETGNSVFSWKKLVTVLLLSSFCLISANFLRSVSSYPFSLSWSEGNRLWDYSMLFGRSRYRIPNTSDISVHLDIGRQLIGGLPFLYSGLTIAQERFWLAIVNILAYLILGWAMFYLPKPKRPKMWILAGIWGLVFLMQGPIHTPLIVVAFLVTLAWGRPLWIAAILVFLAGYIAQVSRFTWMFAPAMWIILLEFSGVQIKEGKIPGIIWKRSISLGLAGLLGGVIVPYLLQLLKTINGAEPHGFANLQSNLSFQQPLLWYRLFPNSTYRPGILLGLLIAIAPLVILLIILMAKKIWLIHPLQKLYAVGCLLAFLFVGLIVSTKIGGGGDLHNLDMLLLGLLFCTVISWRNGGDEWLAANLTKPAYTNYLILILIGIPSLSFLMGLYPLSLGNSVEWVTKFSDNNINYQNIISSNETVQKTFKRLQQEIKKAQKKGEILFMDQRQLLTFGYLKNIELIPEYEKKVMIDQAMASNESYFKPFYEDIAKHRFSLIITFPQSENYKITDLSFNEESNMWIKWVGKPLLCYYKPVGIYFEVNIQLLVPNKKSQDCSNSVPLPMNP